MQPEQAALRQCDRPIHGKWLRAAIRLRTERPDQSGNRSRQVRSPTGLRIQQDTGNWCFSLHWTPYNFDNKTPPACFAGAPTALFKDSDVTEMCQAVVFRGLRKTGG